MGVMEDYFDHPRASLEGFAYTYGGAFIVGGCLIFWSTVVALVVLL